MTLFEPPSIYEKFYRHRIRCTLTCSWSKINCYITLCPESKMLVRKVVHLMWFINLLYEERQFLSFVLVHVEKWTKCQGFFIVGQFWAGIYHYILNFGSYIKRKIVFDWFSINTTWYEFDVSKGFLIELENCRIRIDTQRFYVMITRVLLLFTAWLNKYIKTSTSYCNKRNMHFAWSLKNYNVNLVIK